jgi:hypothetical protein
VLTSCRAPRSRAPWPTWRLWQALVALFLLAGLLTDVWHFGHLIAVRHVACPYDGVLVHEEEVPRGESVEGVGLRREVLPVSVVPHHDHGHCAALATADRRLAIVSVSPSIAARADQPARISLPVVPNAECRSVLSYAPKLSPPV